MTRVRSGSRTNSGSPPPGEPEYLLVGMLRRPHGVHGELLMQVVTHFPERLQPGVQVYVGGAHEALAIAASRSHADGLLIRLENLDSPEAVARLRNAPVYVRASDRPPLPPGQVYHHQLLGCRVRNERGEWLGVVEELLETGANDVYVVRREDSRELLLPAIEGVVMRVDTETRVIVVKVPEGLMPEPARGTGRPVRGRARHGDHR